MEFIWNEHIHDAGALRRDVITTENNFQVTLCSCRIGLPFKRNFKLSNRTQKLFSGVFIQKKPLTCQKHATEAFAFCPSTLSSEVRGTEKPRDRVHCGPVPTATCRLLPRLTSVVLLQILTHKEVLQVSQV